MGERKGKSIRTACSKVNLISYMIHFDNTFIIYQGSLECPLFFQTNRLTEAVRGVEKRAHDEMRKV